MADDALTDQSLPPQPRSRHGFRIAIICALPLEAEMVEMVLDHDWSDVGAKYGKAVGDKNTYTTGVLAGHNVVLAYMPSMGGIDAAGVAAGLRSSFPKVELAIVVGICGVVPKHPKTNQDIFLGDCIISTSVVQYDLGAQYPAGFKMKEGLDSLGRASQEVRSLTAKLTTRRNHAQANKRMKAHLEELLTRCPDIRIPSVERDRLFEPTYIHKHDSLTCDSCQKDVRICSKDCDAIGCDLSFIIQRERSFLGPQIHFGCFGSANAVMKSGQHRDEIARKELIAFEMESAGVWDAFPTMVIKSACDYADSHKSKELQGYAAGSAAAGLKAVLEKLELSDEGIAQDSSLPIKSSNELSDIETKCLQSLCLQPSYRDMKDRTPKRVVGTCNWALSQEIYVKWLQSEGGKLLISADPGCGKSVLAKYLIEEELPRALPGSLICYYFFKDQVQNKLAPALCAICHQILIQDYNLLRKYAVPRFQEDENMSRNTGTLVDIIREVVSDKACKPLVAVFDALDECEIGDCRRLTGLLETLDGTKKLKVILTSRPYYGIVSDYEAVSSRLHIPGEAEIEAISKEVDIVIKQRLEVLCQQKRFDDRTRAELESKLLLEGHRTYLWVYLVFEELETALKMTTKELRAFFDVLPRSVNEAYERILSRYTENATVRGIIRTTLSMLLGAYQPLTIKELQCAVKTELLPNATNLADLDIEPDSDFTVKLRNWCGLFIQVYNDKITFIHQTAREFLLFSYVPDLQAERLAVTWMGSCTMERAHEVIAKACVAYILLCTHPMEYSALERKSETSQTKTTQAFVLYAARHWDEHVRDGLCTGNKELLTKMLLLCDPDRARAFWFEEFQLNMPEKELIFWLRRITMEATYLVFAACLRTDTLIRFALDDACEISEEIDKCLESAVLLGHPNNLKLLLNYATQHGIEIDLKTNLMPLAVQSKRADCLEILLNNGASANWISGPEFDYNTYLVDASFSGDLEAIKILVKHGADLEKPDSKGFTPMHAAVMAKSYSIVAFLLDHGANIQGMGKNGRTPLHEAMEESQSGLASMLLDRGADIEAQDRRGYTPLHTAAMNAEPTALKVLLDRGASKEARDLIGRTPLHAAASSDEEVANVCLLVDRGAILQARDYAGCTPLHVAAANGAIDCVKLLLDLGAEIDARNSRGMTPLARAVCARYFEVVKILLQRDADFHHQDSRGRGILHHAIDPQIRRNGSSDIDDVYVHHREPYTHLRSFLEREVEHGYDLIHLLLNHGARLDLQDEEGHTPMALATRYEMKETIKILRSHGARPMDGSVKSTPPYLYIEGNHPGLVELLLSPDINISIQHEDGTWSVHGMIRCYDGRIPLHVACDVSMKQMTHIHGFPWNSKNDTGPRQYTSREDSNDNSQKSLPGIDSIKLDDSIDVISLTERTSSWQSITM